MTERGSAEPQNDEDGRDWEREAKKHPAGRGVLRLLNSLQEPCVYFCLNAKELEQLCPMPTCKDKTLGL